MALLEIENLTVEFATSSGAFRAVDGVSLAVDPREVLAIVGESGSGKSVSMLAVMGLLPPVARVSADRLRFDGSDLLTLTSGQRRALMGAKISMIFQDPMSSLNPCFTIGFQLTEVLKIHTRTGPFRAPRPCAGIARSCRHFLGRNAAGRLSAPDVRWHEPTRHDRHGDRLQSQAADRRRADDGARRHHPGADPRPSLEASAGNRHGDDPGHSRYGRGGGDSAACLGSLCRAEGGRAAGARPLHRPASSLYVGPARRACPSAPSPATCRQFPVSCLAFSTVRKAACSRRAAATPRSAALLFSR